MKILLFIPSLMAGGAERVMSTVANYLSQDHTVEILMINEITPFYSLNENVTTKYVKTGKRKPGILGAFLFLGTEIKRRKAFIKEVHDYKPDVILSFLTTTNVIALLSLNKIKGIPLIVSERNDPGLYKKSVRWLINKLYPKADLIVCQGKRVAEFFNKIHGRTVVVPNPLNQAALGKFHEKRSDKLVTVGRLTAAKNQKLLIDSFFEIHTEYPNHTLEIYGEGELKEELSNYIDSLNMQNKIKLMGTRKNVMHYIDDAACFILPSNFEGFPNVLIEAMASGLPVISTDFPTGIAKELICDGINGYVVPTDNKKEMVRALRKVLSSEDEQNKIGKNNLQIAEIYSEKNICKLWKDILAKSLDN